VDFLKELKFLPVGRRSLSDPAAQVPLDQISAPHMRKRYECVHRFATTLTIGRGQNVRANRLVGISANQVGINDAFVFVCITEEGEWTDELRLMVNPRIKKVWGHDEMIDWWHGCFSTGCLVTIQSLPRFMEVEYYDRNGRLCTWVIDGVKDGARQLHVAWHEIEHTTGMRHVDHAIKLELPIYVLLTHERRGFNAAFLAGRRDWHRTLPPEGWYAMLGNRAWRYLVNSNR